MLDATVIMGLVRLSGNQPQRFEQQPRRAFPCAGECPISAAIDNPTARSLDRAPGLQTKHASNSKFAANFYRAVADLLADRLRATHAGLRTGATGRRPCSPAWFAYPWRAESSSASSSKDR